jgi:ATP-dependent exoDNAse (exonuclease V) beta subunit
MSKELGIYRQKWCGCILRMKEALAQQKEAEERKAAQKAERAARLAAEDEERRRALAGRELLVQGVIDCLLEEGQDYVLIDYKTDRLSEAEKENPALAAKKLTERHALQLTYYAAACERMYGKPPAEVLIYSLPLGDAVKVPL